MLNALLALAVCAQPAPVPWEVTGTSSAAVSEPATEYRVERRFFEKSDRFVAKAGFSYLSRGDFYENPGVSLDLSWYPLEYVAIDFVSATAFFSGLGSTAAALREDFGILPDSQKPVARVTTGGRFAFAYGKILIEEVGAVIHLDASIGLHLGALVTDEAVNFGGDVGLSFQAAAFSRVLVWLDISWFGSFENRSTSSFASGPLGTIGVGLLLIAVVALLAANVGGVTTPTSDAAVLSRFLDGDLVTLRRAAVLRRAAGERVDIGRLALLDDLSRLVRCLPIGPIPADESTVYRPARELVRLERVRLERLVRDRAHRGTTLASLLGPARLYQSNGPADPRIVRWPIEDEVWPGETPDPTLAPAGCPSRAGPLAERPNKIHRERRRTRLRAERGRIASMLGALSALPPTTASKIALLYLSDAESVDGFVVERKWRDAITTAVAAGPDGPRTASRILLGRLAERDEAAKEAIAHYRAVLGDPSRTTEEDSRTRVRLAVLLEPDWPAVLEVVRGVQQPRPADELVLINAEARALFSLGDTEALMSLGRKLVVRPGLFGPFFSQTVELLTQLALDLEPSRAIAWLAEIAPADRDRKGKRYEELAEMARERSKFDLAVAIYDHRRLQLLEGPRRNSPRVAAEDVHLIARRAVIEYDREDVEAFGGFVDELVTHASEQEGRPLARFAPHKELARLTQDLLGRLTDDVKDDPERQKFAALLLEANAALTKRPSRHRRVLERHQPHLIRLAGEYAEGRKPVRRRTTRKKKKPVKQLGEVVVARLPPRLDPPDVATTVPVIRSLLVYEERPGVWSEGAPWARLVPEKKRR